MTTTGIEQNWNGGGWARFVSTQNLVNLLYRKEEREMLPLCAAEGMVSLRGAHRRAEG